MYADTDTELTVSLLLTVIEQAKIGGASQNTLQPYIDMLDVLRCDAQIQAPQFLPASLLRPPKFGVSG